MTNQNVAECLAKTERAHRGQFPEGRSADDSWPKWYAGYLLQSTDFLQHVKRDWNQDDLAEALSDLAGAYNNSNRRQPWYQYASTRLEI